MDFVGKSSNSKQGKEEDGMPNAEGVKSNSYVSINFNEIISFNKECSYKIPPCIRSHDTGWLS